MNCPICHAEMVMDYKIKVENYLLFNMITIKKGSDQKKIKAAFCPSCGKIELYADIPSGEKEYTYPVSGMLKQRSPDRR